MHMNSNHPLKLLALAQFFANYQFKSVMVVSCLDLTVQLKFNLTLKWIILTCFLLISACIDYCMYWLLHVTRELLMCHFTHNHQKNTPVYKSNASKFSKCDSHHKQSKTLKILLVTNIASRFCIMHFYFF